MKIFILSDAANIHTKRWVSALSENNLAIYLFSLNTEHSDFYNKKKNVTVFSFEITDKLKNKRKNGSLEKLKYLSVIKNLRKKIKDFKPDILHAHYASSYGLLGALSNFHPYIISVWGSDVYDFPKVSFLHKSILKYNLSKADKILSTSQVMAKETNKYTNKEIDITPFGVNLDLFKKTGTPDSEQFIVGNVKTLAPKYGIDILIKAFKVVVDNNPNIDPNLIIIGDGEQKDELAKLAQDLSLESKISFLGKIENNLLPQYYNSFSVFVTTSILNSESFGVVAVEAMACECPVVVSDADGFTEVVVDNETGFIVPKGDIEATANAIQKFIDDEKLRNIMGEKGRKRVKHLYNWKMNVNKMVKIYHILLLH